MSGDPDEERTAWESYDNSDFSEYETSPVPSMPVLGDKSSKYRKAAARKAPMGTRAQCLHFARWIPRAIDMFCSLDNTFRTAILMEEEEAVKTFHKPEDERVAKEREAFLSQISKDDQERCKRNFARILLGAPYLRVLVSGDKEQQEELSKLLAEMQTVMGQARADDSSHLKSSISQYAVLEPTVKGLEPPIFMESKSRARMGVNHPQLAAMLCPIKHAKAYHENPKSVQAQLQNGEIEMRAGGWPAFAYAGNPPGEEFDPENVQEGFLKGYYLQRVFSHIFTSPSSVFVKDASGAKHLHPGNGKLHQMQRVEAEHIAYAFVQARFSIAARDKWQEIDGLYNYRDVYKRIIRAIQEAPDQTWAASLLDWWNENVFGKKEGTSSSKDEDEDDDLALMKKQYEMRIVAAHHQVEPDDLPTRNSVLPGASPSPSPTPGPSSNTMDDATALDTNTSRKRKTREQIINDDDNNSAVEGTLDTPSSRRQVRNVGGSMAASKRSRRN